MGENKLPGHFTNLQSSIEILYNGCNSCWNSQEAEEIPKHYRLSMSSQSLLQNCLGLRLSLGLAIAKSQATIASNLSLPSIIVRV